MASMEVPTSQIGRIIGTKGATLQGIQQQYGVRVSIPSKEQQGPVTTVIQLQGRDMEGAKAAINRIVQGPGGGNGSGSGGGMGGRGMGSRSMMACVYLFRLADDTRELQLLLEHKGGRWDVPKDALTQMGDNDRDYEAGVERVVLQKFGGGDPQPPLHGLAPLDTIPLQGKRIKPLLVPADWQGWFPVPQGSKATPTDACIVNGAVFESVCNCAWVDVGHIMADIQNMSRDLQLFFDKNGHPLQQAASEYYGMAMQLTQRQQQVADPMVLLGKFYSLVNRLATMSPQDFQQAVDSAFDARILTTITQRWESKFGDLPAA